MFEILLHVLAAYLAASRVWFSEHAHVQKCVSLATKDANATILQEREELRDVIIATQESAATRTLCTNQGGSGKGNLVMYTL